MFPSWFKALAVCCFLVKHFRHNWTTYHNKRKPLLMFRHLTGVRRQWSQSKHAKIEKERWVKGEIERKVEQTAKKRYESWQREKHDIETSVPTHHFWRIFFLALSLNNTTFHKYQSSSSAINEQFHFPHLDISLNHFQRQCCPFVHPPSELRLHWGCS